MDPKILIAQCQLILNQALAMGQVPIMFVMNDTTCRAIGDYIRLQAKESRIVLLKRKLLKKPIPKMTNLFGLPIMENSHLPDFVISLQWAPTRDIKHGEPMATVGTNVAEANQPGVQANPFIKQEPIASSPAEDKAITLEDIAQGNGNRVTVTDVLIRGLENAEAIAHVVVIRKYHNGDVDLAMSCNPDEAVGVVQKAQMWLAQNGR